MSRIRSSVLAQTALITAGGFLLVRVFALHSTMSTGELLIGPLSLAALWMGLRGPGPTTGAR
jgi:hypothetical protein